MDSPCSGQACLCLSKVSSSNNSFRHQVSVSLTACKAAMSCSSPSELKRLTKPKRETCQKYSHGNRRCLSTWSPCFCFLPLLLLCYWYRKYDSWIFETFFFVSSCRPKQPQNNFSLFPSTKGWNFRGVSLVLFCSYFVTFLPASLSCSGTL